MYNIGDIFNYDEDYINKVNFCNENNLKIVEIESDNTGRRFQIQQLPELTETEILDDLRVRRTYECFPIINRGILWYNKLTEQQKEELDIWYQAWLDVTETKIIPEKPDWID